MKLLPTFCWPQTYLFVHTCTSPVLYTLPPPATLDTDPPDRSAPFHGNSHMPMTHFLKSTNLRSASRTVVLSAALLSTPTAISAPQTPAPGLLVTPSAATLLVGEPAAFSAVDDSGRPLTDVHWSLDPPLAELHVENGEITLGPEQPGLRTHSHGRQSVCHRHHRYRRRRQASRRHGALVAPALAGLRNSVRSPIRSRTFRSRVLLRGMEKIRERRRPRLTNLWPTALDDSALLLPINRHGLLSSSRTSNGRFPRYHWPKWLA